MAPKTFTIDECLKHCDDKDCWLIIDGKVYDVTRFLDEHPGGYDTLVSNSGEAPAAINSGAPPSGRGC